jgi:histidyl-tRNA synthetase
VLILGEKEIEEGSAILRNMSTREQVPITIENLVENVKSELSSVKQI